MKVKMKMFLLVFTVMFAGMHSMFGQTASNKMNEKLSASAGRIVRMSSLNEDSAKIKLALNKGLDDELNRERVGSDQANYSGKMFSGPNSGVTKDEMMIRIAEIEIVPEQLEAYKAILKVEAAASVEKEVGVLAIFPMYQIEQPNQIRIVEIYANRNAYLAHLQTEHFLQYKNSTSSMVKSLKLVEMDALDPDTMAKIFRKIN